jgi:hypothetical protein
MVMDLYRTRWMMALTLLAALETAQAQGPTMKSADLWGLAQSKSEVHRYSTLFTAQDVRSQLSTDEGIRKAIDWCKKTGVTKVYIEEFRGGYQAERGTLVKARDAFRAAGIVASGCVTTVKVGKVSDHWKEACCYTDEPTQEKLRAIFEYTAELFDEIMIDDFWFTDCTCPQCEAARQAKMVTIGGKTYPVADDTWEAYRCELLTGLSREYILKAARRINPNVKIIIKYPQWYDQFHERGYDVARETADFDRIWVGTETRDYTNKQWGGTPQYEGFFIMRWLGGIGGEKCGGGWFDPYGTTEATYIEQARQTILGGGGESMLFCYGSLMRDTGPKNIEALRRNIPELLTVAEEVRKREITGIAAYKPVSSHPENESRVFDFVGMIGLPLAPCHEFPATAPSAFFSVHALKDPDLAAKLEEFINAGKTVLLTDGLVAKLGDKVNSKAPNVMVLEVKGNPKGLLDLSQAELDKISGKMLGGLKVKFKAPGKVGCYLFKDGSWAVENFNDEAVKVELQGKTMDLAARGWAYQFESMDRR